MLVLMSAAACGFNPAVDTNGDWHIDLSDCVAIAQHWLDSCTSPSWCDETDSDHSGRVDNLDFSLLAESWLSTPQIVINEIMYHSQGNIHDYEFIELYNCGDFPIDLNGWIIEDAVNFIFPFGSIIGDKDYLVVCRNESVVQSVYGITNTVGNYYDDKLNNSGERIVLKTNTGMIIDEVTYSDGSHPEGGDPWPVEADGAGPSLELISPQSNNSLADNWGIGQLYTPGGANNPQTQLDGDIVINEIMYKPLREELRERFGGTPQFYYEDGDDLYGEYIELYNRSDTLIDISGWSFTDGINYTFPPATALDPNTYLVVAADPGAVQLRFNINNVTGPFNRRLDDGGERITLNDAQGKIVDTTRYNDRHPWTVAPDEDGSSLERLVAGANSATAANWRASQTDLGSHSQPDPDTDTYWQYVTVTGQATSNTINFYVNGTGQWLVDDIKIGAIADPNTNIIENGSFEPDDSGWSKTGNHSGTYRSLESSVEGAGCEHILATAAGDSSTNNLNREVLGLVVGQTYTVSCWVAHITGNETITVCLSGSMPGNGIYADVQREIPATWDLLSDFTISANPTPSIDGGNGHLATWTYHSGGQTYTRSYEGPQANANGEMPSQGIGWSGESATHISLNRFDSADATKTNYGPDEVGGHASTGATWTTQTGGTFRIDYSGYNARIQALADPENEADRQTTLEYIDPVNGVITRDLRGSTNEGVANAVVPGPVYVSLLPGQSVTVQQGGSDWVGITFTVTEVSQVSQGAETLEPPLAGYLGKGTPGRVNSVVVSDVPPLVSELAHLPLTPTSADDVTVTGRITSENSISSSVQQLEILHGTATSGTLLNMYDDGLHGDGAAGDGVYGVVIPAEPSQTLVHYRVHAQDDFGNSTRFPYDDDPSPTQAYYHYDGEITTGMTLAHLFITQENINFLESNIWTEEYVDCTLVINHIAYPHIKTRYRGHHSSRPNPKRPRKFKFNRNQLYNGNRVYDTMISIPFTQKMVYNICDIAEITSLESDLMRLHINGEFWGVYIGFETPNNTWVDKHNYHADSEVYKARTCATDKNSDLFLNNIVTDYDYWGAFNKKTKGLEPPTHIRDLVENLNNLSDEELLPWLDANVDLDHWLTHWALYIYVRMDDICCHNNYLFLSGDANGKWKMFGYDYDSQGRGIVVPFRLFYGDGLGAGDLDWWQQNMFYRRASQNLTLRRIHLLNMRRILQEMPPASLYPMIDGLFAQIEPDRIDELAKWGTSYAYAMRTSTTKLKSDIAAQEAYMYSELAAENLPGDSDIPGVSPAGGAFAGSVAVTLTPQAGWDAYYTLDGSDPRLSDTRQPYTAPITITTSSALRTAASLSGQPFSAGQWTGLVQYDFTIY